MKSLPVVILILSTVSSVLGQKADPANLLESLDPATRTVSGVWKKGADGLGVTPDKAARIILAESVPSSFDLSVGFTRTEGTDSIVVILPAGDSSVALELSSWAGEAHGLSRVDGLPSKAPDNPTSVRPGSLTNGKKHLLEVSVREVADSFHVQAKLDGKPLVDWKGNRSRLQPNIALNLEKPHTLGLAVCNSGATFHRIDFQPLGEPVNPPSPKVSSAEFEPFNGAALSDETKNGQTIYRSRPEVGNGDRGAFLKGAEFSEGTIELDLRGSGQPQSSFLGVVFNAVDGDTYEAVYFRPFNFGSPDKVRQGHAVQYISHPDWPWQKLRQQRPEEFENPVKPEPEATAWFRARIEVTESRVKVFVDDADEPSLDVERLAKSQGKKVGIWFNGIASFSKVTLTEKDGNE